MSAETPNPELSRERDRALVDRLMRGEERAFDEFSDTMIPILYRFALRRLDGDAELARDIVQTTLCKVIQKLDTFRGDAALSTWLCSCCRNEILMHFRRAGSRPEEVEMEELGPEPGFDACSQVLAGQEAQLFRKESAHLVHEVLDLLPERYASALAWKYLEDLPVKQIAWRLQIGDKAAESLLTRARDAFRTSYTRLCHDATETVSSTVSALETAGSPS